VALGAGLFVFWSLLRRFRSAGRGHRFIADFLGFGKRHQPGSPLLREREPWRAERLARGRAGRERGACVVEAIRSLLEEARFPSWPSSSQLLDPGLPLRRSLGLEHGASPPGAAFGMDRESPAIGKLAPWRSASLRLTVALILAGTAVGIALSESGLKG